MNDKEFYGECVKRILPPLKSKTDIELVRIVLQNTYVDVGNMFTSNNIYELFDKDSLKDKTNILGQAYNFIRDNQDLYVNPYNMNSEQIYKIINDKNAMNIITSTQYNEEDSRHLVNSSIYSGKTNIAMYFMQRGIMPRTDTALFLSTLAKDPKHISVLNYLVKKEIDLFNLGNGNLVQIAALNDNRIALDLLLHTAPIDSYIIKKTLSNYIGSNFSYKPTNQRSKRDLPQIAQDMIPIMQTLMYKLSLESSQQIIDEVKETEIKEVMEQLHLVVTLDRMLPNNHIASPRNKI